MNRGTLARELEQRSGGHPGMRAALKSEHVTEANEAVSIDPGGQPDRQATDRLADAVEDQLGYEDQPLGRYRYEGDNAPSWRDECYHAVCRSA